MKDKILLQINNGLRLGLRLSAGLLILVLIWSCASVPGLKEDSIATFIRVPFVRVLLEDNTDAVALDADEAFAIECLRGDQQQVFYSSQPVRVRNVGMALEVTNVRDDVIEEGLTEVNIIPRGSGNRIVSGKRRYRGIMKIIPNGRNVRLVNIVHMEDYLRGVVPPELGKRDESELEAVKAQAVAARTYAMSHLQQYGAEPYDVKSSIIDQLYEGVTVEEKLVNRAIDETSGLVITYHDEMIDAYYHSTCGGMTDDIVDVWGKAETGYLKPVVDTACSWSKYYTWREDFTEAQLRGRFEQYLSRDRGRELRIGRLTDLEIVGRTAGGRVAELVVRSENEVFRFRADRIRWVVGRTSNPDLILPSSNFTLDLRRDNQGQLVEIIFKGAGYGHGIGMCQCGAIGHARQGWTFGRILSYYYRDAEIKALY